MSGDQFSDLGQVISEPQFPSRYKGGGCLVASYPSLHSGSDELC